MSRLLPFVPLFGRQGTKNVDMLTGHVVLGGEKSFKQWPLSKDRLYCTGEAPYI